MKYAVGQMLRTARKFGLKILVPEELRVRQACPQHAFVARDDGGPAILRLDIGDHDETWRERPIGVEQREILLMRPHRGDQHFVRHVHEVVVDPAGHDDRPFDQPHDLVQQAGIVAQAEPFSAAAF